MDQIPKFHMCYLLTMIKMMAKYSQESCVVGKRMQVESRRILIGKEQRTGNMNPQHQQSSEQLCTLRLFEATVCLFTRFKLA